MNEAALQEARARIVSATWWLEPLDGKYADVIDVDAHSKLAEAALREALENVRNLRSVG